MRDVELPAGVELPEDYMYRVAFHVEYVFHGVIAPGTQEATDEAGMRLRTLLPNIRPGSIVLVETTKIGRIQRDDET